MLRKKTKVLVFGYFGKKSHVQEGQSVKTRNMSRLFKEMGCNVEGLIRNLFAMISWQSLK